MIPLFAVDGNIQAVELLLLGHAQPHCGLDDPADHQSADEGEGGRGCNPRDLFAELDPAAADQTDNGDEAEDPRTAQRTIRSRRN